MAEAADWPDTRRSRDAALRQPWMAINMLGSTLAALISRAVQPKNSLRVRVDVFRSRISTSLSLGNRVACGRPDLLFRSCRFHVFL
jgi:hypothetical protein